MFSPLMKLSCAALLCSSLALTGCDAVESDAAQADRRVSQYLAAGDLTKAAAITNASAPVRARVLSLLAAAEIDKARVAQQTIDQNMAKVNLLGSEMTLLADSIQNATLMAAGTKKLDPAAFQKTAKERTEKLGGKDAAEWFKTGPVSVATRAALEQRLATLEADIKKLDDQKSAAQTQRNKLLADADTLTATPIEDKKASLDQHRKATEMRKQAGDLGIDIDKINAQQIPLQQDADVAKAQIAGIDKTIKDLQQHSDSAGKAWTDIQKNVADQSTAAALLARNAGSSSQPGGHTIAELAGQLDQAVGLARTAIEDASKNLTAAADYTEQASKSAGEYGAELRKRKSENEQSGMVTDLNLMESAVSPVNYQLKRAALLRTQAILATNLGDLLTTRSSIIEAVVPILKAAGLDVPPALGGDSATARKEISDAYKAATDHIEASTRQLDGLAVIGSDERVEADKNIQTVLNNFALSNICRATGDTQKESTLKAAAVTLAKDLADKGKAIPSLPVLIKEPPVPQAPAPAPTPAPTPAAPPEPAPAEPEAGN